jgi:hypothetical protein
MNTRCALQRSEYPITGDIEKITMTGCRKIVRGVR